MPLQIRRGTDAERQILAVPLADGELLWTTDLKQLFVGDGVTLAQNASPVVGYNDENAQDAASALFTHSNHTGLTFTYDDNTGQVLGSLDLATQSVGDFSDVDLTGVSNGDLLIFNSSSGNFEVGSTVTADVFGNVTGDLTGSIFANDSTTIIDSTNASVNLDGTVKGNIIPNANEAYDLGTNSSRFKDLYLSGSSLFLGDAQITSSGSSINLPIGSTINGEPLGPATFAGTNLNVNIVGDDSTVMVNTSTEIITAQGGFIGDVTGDVIGNVTGDVTGNLIGDITGSVFSADSTALIDSNNNTISDGIISINNGIITTLGNNTISPAINVGLQFGTVDDPCTPVILSEQGLMRFRGINPGLIKIQMSRGSLASPSASGGLDFLGGVIASGYDGTQYVDSGFFGMLQDPAKTVSAGDMPGLFAVQLFEGGVQQTGELLTFDSDGLLSVKAITAQSITADLTGSVFSDSSTMLIDGTDGKLMAANIDVVGETGNTPADTGNVDSWLEVTVNGATKYIPLYD